MSSRDDRPLVMGVLNVTPDSFSDGGRYVELADAVEQGRQMAAAGADVVDVGGESTRPGALLVPEEEELRRVLPVIEALAGSVRLSIDTKKPAVARAAVAAGATLLNDISGTLWPLAAELSIGWVGMHMRGTPQTMQTLTTYDDVVREVSDHLLSCADLAAGAGVREVWIDPGIGFAKTAAQNLALLAALDTLVADAALHGARVLVGTSRKSFLGHLPAASEHSTEPEPTGVLDRFEPSLATAVWAMAKGVQMIRVHDVEPTVQAALVVGAPDGGRSGGRTRRGHAADTEPRSSERTAAA